MLIWPIWSLESKIKLTNGINLFFACYYNFMKINVKVLGVGIVKNGCGQFGYRTLKLIVPSTVVFCMLVQIQES